MTYLDPVNNVRIEQLAPLTNFGGVSGAGTDYAPSYSAPNFTRAFDARPYMSALLIVPIETIGGNVTATMKLQSSAEPFTTWTDISGAAWTARTESNDQTVLAAKIDLSKHQNAIGWHRTSPSPPVLFAPASGPTRCCFPTTHPTAASPLTSPRPWT